MFSRAAIVMKKIAKTNTGIDYEFVFRADELDGVGLH